MSIIASLSSEWLYYVHITVSFAVVYWLALVSHFVAADKTFTKNYIVSFISK